MDSSSSKKLQAAIRFYSDASRTVKLIDPILITDFDSVENFDFDKPHMIHQIVGGKRQEVPVQVFAISEDEKELENPEKRRIFSNKRKSDVLEELLKEKEKEEAEKKIKSKSAKTTKQKVQDSKNEEVDIKVTDKTKQIKLHLNNLKAKAKTASKERDASILNEKLQQIKKQKLLYSDDCGIIEETYKKAYDLKQQCSIKDNQLEEVKKKHEIELMELRKKLIEQEKLLEENKTFLAQMQNQNVIIADNSDFRKMNSSEFHEKLSNFEQKEKIIEENPSGSSQIPDDKDQWDDDCINDNGMSNKNDESEIASDSSLSFEKSPSRNALFAYGTAKVEEKEKEKYDIISTKPVCGNLTNITNIDKKALKRKKTRKQSNKENEVSKYMNTKKYSILFSDSDSDSDSYSENDKGSDHNKKKRSSYGRASDDEYDSDHFEKFKQPDFTSYIHAKRNGKNVKMFHLKYGVKIKYEIWNELKKITDMKEYLRTLVHAVYEEEVLINKVFKKSTCKDGRLPGQIRNEFTPRKKAAIRKTYFTKVNLSFKDSKERRRHRNNWKTYIGDHINSLIERAKKQLKQKEEAKKKKEAAKLMQQNKQTKQIDSFSSSEDSENESNKIQTQKLPMKPTAYDEFSKHSSNFPYNDSE